MHIHILDGSQGMCSNAPSDDAAAGSMAVSSTPAGRVSNSHDQPFKSRVNSSRIDTVTTGSGTSSTLASWLAPSTSTSTGEPSKRATSIPDPAGASAPSAFQEDVDNDQEDGYTDAGNTRRPSLPSSSRHQPSSSTLSALLEPFTPSNRDQTSGRIKIPPTSRAGADIAEQKTASGVGLLESWKYLPFLAHQASKLASAFVSHHVFGPPKKSWGIELTLFTTAIRESVQYSHLSSLPTLRRFLNLGQILPVPKDGVVTPVTFQVFKRNLPGILAEFDNKEDGTRELTGEWVVSKRIWRRMQREHYGHGHPGSASGHSPSSSTRRKMSASSSKLRNNSMNSPSSTSASAPPPTSSTSSTNRPPPRHSDSTSSSYSPRASIGKDKVILYLHGGAYYTMSAATHRYITISVSKYTNCRVFAVNYRLAPECRWPGQIHDAVSAYLRLIQDLKIPPEIIIFAGDSAGGGLTLATIMYLRDHGFPLPCGAIVMSPWVDLTMSCDSWETNAPYDYLRMPSGDDHMNPIASLLGASNVKNLITHPYVSPLFGDFHDFPPLLIQCGDAECLRDEGTLLAHKASLAGVQVYHEVYEDCPHVFQAMFFLEASKKAFRSHRHFVRRILPSPSSAYAVSGPGSTATGTEHARVGAAGTGRRRERVDLSEMDQEVMSDAHNIKADGQAEVESLPASPRAPRRELSSLTPLHASEPVTPGGSRIASADAPSRPKETPLDGDTSAKTPSGFLEDEEGDLGYDDEEDDEDDSNPFNVESSGASATNSELDTSSTADDGEFEQLPPSSSSASGSNMPLDSMQDAGADFALNATAEMVKLGSMISPSTHHDLDSVAEEQDESIEKMEMEEDYTATGAAADKSAYTQQGSAISRSASSQRLHANHPHPHQHLHYPHYASQHRNGTSNTSTPAHSPSASFTSLPHSSPSGSHTPLASRTPTSSAPPSPGTSIRNSNRQRSFSSLSMASLTPSSSMKRHQSAASSSHQTNPDQDGSSTGSSRPGHSRSSSSVSIRTMRPGHFREMSKPRARANSHPDLQALLDSYDAAGPAQHTVLWRSEDGEDDLGQDVERGQTMQDAKKEGRLSSDDDIMDHDEFDT